ncbi:MAG: sodium:proton antiporter [bacterium]
MNYLKIIIPRIDYIASVILFCIGFYAVVIKPNIIKKVIGLNIMETSVYLFLIASSDIRFGPLLSNWAMPNELENAIEAAEAAAGHVPMVNPVPSALILTAIVVSLSITAFTLALAVAIYNKYGTLDTRKISTLRG